MLVIKSVSQSVVQFIPKVLDGVEVRPVRFFNTKLGRPFLVMLKQGRVKHKLLTKRWKNTVVCM